MELKLEVIGIIMEILILVLKVLIMSDTKKQLCDTETEGDSNYEYSDDDLK